MENGSDQTPLGAPAPALISRRRLPRWRYVGVTVEFYPFWWRWDFFSIGEFAAGGGIGPFRLYLNWP